MRVFDYYPAGVQTLYAYAAAHLTGMHMHSFNCVAIMPGVCVFAGQDWQTSRLPGTPYLFRSHITLQQSIRHNSGHDQSILTGLKS